MTRFFRSLLLVAVSAACCANEVDFGHFAAKNSERLWELSAADLNETFGELVPPRNASGDLFYSRGVGKTKVSLRGRAVDAVVFHFKNGKLAAMALTLVCGRNELAEATARKRIAVQLLDECKKFSPDSGKAIAYNPMEHRGVRLEVTGYSGLACDARVAARSQHAKIGTVLFLELLPPGTLQKTSAPSATPAMENFLAKYDSALWELAPEKFSADFPRMKWGDAARTKLTYLRKPDEKNAVLFAGMPILELNASFVKGKLDGIEFYLFSRAENGMVDKKTLEDWKERAQQGCVALTGVDKPKIQNLKLNNNTKLVSQLFHMTNADVQLRWDETRTGTTFLSINIRPVGTIDDLRKSTASDIDARTLKGRIRHGENGDIFLEIPMVDQGGKGYCVAATVCRVMQYYGIEIDQFLLASLLNVDADEGVAIGDAFDKLSHIRTKSKIRLFKLYENAAFKNARDLERMVNDYNRIIKKSRSKLRYVAPARVKVGRIATYSVPGTLAQMNYTAFREFRAKDKNGMKNFEKLVTAQIAKGIPLCWAVFVCKGVSIQDPAIVDATGHLRLIVGYNHEAHEIVYSDSYGAGHELKRMPLEDAWAVTVTLFVIAPR